MHIFLFFFFFFTHTSSVFHFWRLAWLDAETSRRMEELTSLSREEMEKIQKLRWLPGCGFGDRFLTHPFFLEHGFMSFPLSHPIFTAACFSLVLFFLFVQVRRRISNTAGRPSWESSAGSFGAPLGKSTGNPVKAHVHRVRATFRFVTHVKGESRLHVPNLFTR